MKECLIVGYKATCWGVKRDDFLTLLSHGLAKRNNLEGERKCKVAKCKQLMLESVQEFIFIILATFL